MTPKQAGQLEIPETLLCPCPCRRPIKPGNTFAGSGCAYRMRSDKKTSPVQPGVNKYREGARSAVERGIPVRVVDAIIDVMGVDESQLTADALLDGDLQCDELDLVEIAEQFGIDDRCLDWKVVGDIVKSVRA